MKNIALSVVSFYLFSGLSFSYVQASEKQDAGKALAEVFQELPQKVEIYRTLMIRSQVFGKKSVTYVQSIEDQTRTLSGQITQNLLDTSRNFKDRFRDSVQNIQMMIIYSNLLAEDATRYNINAPVFRLKPAYDALVFGLSEFAPYDSSVRSAIGWDDPNKDAKYKALADLSGLINLEIARIRATLKENQIGRSFSQLMAANTKLYIRSVSGNTKEENALTDAKALLIEWERLESTITAEQRQKISDHLKTLDAAMTALAIYTVHNAN